MNEWREGFHLMLMKHCAGHRLQSNTQPTSRGHHSLVHSLAGSFGSRADGFGVDSLFFMSSSSSPPPPRPPPHCLLYWFAGPCLHSEWGGGVSHLCPLRHGQKKAAFAPEGLHLPGAEQVLLMLKVKILPVLCHDHGGCRLWRGRDLNYLRSLLQEEHGYTIRYGALRTKLH